MPFCHIRDAIRHIIRCYAATMLREPLIYFRRHTPFMMRCYADELMPPPYAAERQCFYTLPFLFSATILYIQKRYYAMSLPLYRHATIACLIEMVIRHKPFRRLRLPHAACRLLRHAATLMKMPDARREGCATIALILLPLRRHYCRALPDVTLPPPLRQPGAGCQHDCHYWLIHTLMSAMPSHFDITEIMIIFRHHATVAAVVLRHSTVKAALQYAQRHMKRA